MAASRFQLAAETANATVRSVDAGAGAHAAPPEKEGHRHGKMKKHGSRASNTKSSESLPRVGTEKRRRAEVLLRAPRWVASCYSPPAPPNPPPNLNWWHRARWAVREYFVRQPFFDGFIMVVILANSVTLAMSDPVNPNTPLQRAIQLIDFVFLIVFTLEMVLKMFALGLYSSKTFAFCDRPEDKSDEQKEKERDEKREAARERARQVELENLRRQAIAEGRPPPTDMGMTPGALLSPGPALISGEGDKGEKARFVPTELEADDEGAQLTSEERQTLRVAGRLEAAVRAVDDGEMPGVAHRQMLTSLAVDAALDEGLGVEGAADLGDLDEEEEVEEGGEDGAGALVSGKPGILVDGDQGLEGGDAEENVAHVASHVASQSQSTPAQEVISGSPVRRRLVPVVGGKSGESVVSVVSVESVTKGLSAAADVVGRATAAEVKDSMDDSAYFDSPWNILDFVIVVAGLVSLLPSVSGAGANAVRLLRVLRPLRSINRLEGLKVIIGALLDSMSGLAQVLFLLSFLFVIFGIITLQLWNGVLHRHCFEPGTAPPPYEFPQREDAYAVTGFCQPRSEGTDGVTCPADEECLPRLADPGYGTTSFDNFGLALLNIYIVTTLANWAQIMYSLQDATGPAVPAIIFVLVILIGTFFAMNLVLAVVVDGYGENARAVKQARILRMAVTDDEVEAELAGRELLPDMFAESDRLGMGRREQYIARLRMQRSLSSTMEENPDASSSKNLIADRSSTQKDDTSSKTISPSGRKIVPLELEMIARSTRVPKVEAGTGGATDGLRITEGTGGTGGIGHKEDEDEPSDDATLVSSSRLGGGKTTDRTTDGPSRKHRTQPRERSEKENDEENEEEEDEGDDDDENDHSDQITPLHSPREDQMPSVAPPARAPPRIGTTHGRFASAPMGQHQALTVVRRAAAQAAQQQQNTSDGTSSQNDGDSPSTPKRTMKRLPSAQTMARARAAAALMALTPGQELENSAAGSVFAQALLARAQTENISLSTMDHRERMRLAAKRALVAETLRRQGQLQTPAQRKKQRKRRPGPPSQSNSTNPQMSREPSTMTAPTSEATTGPGQGGDVAADSDQLPDDLEDIYEPEPEEDVGRRFLSALRYVREADRVLRRQNEWLVGKPAFVIWNYRLAISPWFSAFIVLAILVNTVVLAADHYGISQEVYSALELTNTILTVIFFMEMVVKMLAFGLREYVADGFNIFDAVVVVVSVVELFVTTFAADALSSDTGAVSVLRAFRLLRVLKLARNVKSLRILLVTIMESLADIGYMTLLLVLFIFLFAVLGRQLFGGVLADFTYSNGEQPLYNFTSFMEAVFIVFMVITGDNWPGIMQDTLAATRSGWSMLYFLVLQAFGAYVVLSLFIAILLERFSEQTDESFDEEDLAELAQKLRKEENSAELGQSLVFGSPIPAAIKVAERMVEVEVKRDREVDVKRHRYYDKKEATCAGLAFGFLPPTSPIRQFLFSIVTQRWFEGLVIFVIVLNCVFLALEGPDVKAGSPLHLTLFYGDFIFTIFFSIEAIAKMIAFGLRVKRYGYFRSGWNNLDFFVVIVSILSLAFPQLTALRALRSLRPLRVIVRSKQIQVVVQALFYALPNIVNVFGLTLLFWIIFGILGVSLYKGKFYSCTDPSIEIEANCTGTFGGSGVNNTGSMEREWVNPETNFDNVGIAALTLFQVATLSDWASVAKLGVAAREPGLAPEDNHDPSQMFFFFAFIIIGSFFALNLFVGVVIDNFNRLKQEFDGSAFLTAEQRQWTNAQRLIATVKLEGTPDPPESLPLRICFNIVTHPFFDQFIMGCIVSNTVVMCLQYYGQPDAWSTFLEVANLFFTIVFTLEMVLKISGLGFRAYTRDGWNRFDGTVVVLSIIGLFVDAGVGASVVRVFRIARVLRLIKRAKTLQNLFQTLLFSLPSLWNIGGLLLVLFFIFAVLGTTFFGEAPFEDEDDFGISRHAHFRTFGVAMLTLWRLATGDAWETIFYSANAIDPVIAPIYFVLFQIFVSFIMTQLLIAIVLENFSDSQEKEKQQDEMEQIVVWGERWSKYDPLAIKAIPAALFPRIMGEAPPPFGFGTTLLRNGQVLERLINLRIPIFPKNAKQTFIGAGAAVRQTLAELNAEGNWGYILKRKSSTASGPSLRASRSTGLVRTKTFTLGRNKVHPAQTQHTSSQLPASSPDSAAPHEDHNSDASSLILNTAGEPRKDVWCTLFLPTMYALARKVIDLDIALDDAEDQMFMHEYWAVYMISTWYQEMSAIQKASRSRPTQSTVDNTMRREISGLSHEPIAPVRDLSSQM